MRNGTGKSTTLRPASARPGCTVFYSSHLMSEMGANARAGRRSHVPHHFKATCLTHAPSR